MKPPFDSKTTTTTSTTASAEGGGGDRSQTPLLNATKPSNVTKRHRRISYDCLPSPLEISPRESISSQVSGESSSSSFRSPKSSTSGVGGDKVISRSVVEESWTTDKPRLHYCKVNVFVEGDWRKRLQVRTHMETTHSHMFELLL